MSNDKKPESTQDLTLRMFLQKLYVEAVFLDADEDLMRALESSARSNAMLKQSLDTGDFEQIRIRWPQPIPIILVFYAVREYYRSIGFEMHMSHRTMFEFHYEFRRSDSGASIRVGAGLEDDRTLNIIVL